MFKMLRQPWVLLLMLFVAFGSPLVHAQSDQTVAMQFLQKTKINLNLYMLSHNVIINTTTFQIMVKNGGLQKAQNLVLQNMRQVLPKFQPQWDANMAEIYVKHFSSVELQSLADEGLKSPWVQKMQSPVVQDVVGNEIREKSSALLQEAAAEVLSRAFEQHTLLKKNAD